MSSSDPNATCWTLIEAAASGRAAERETFARRYAPVVRSYLGARWRGTAYQRDVEDTCQEVFLECFRRGGVLQKADRARSGGFRAYLFGVVRHVALRHEQRRARSFARRAQEGVDPDLVEDDDARLSRAFDRAWARTIMKEAACVQEERAQERGEAALRRVELLRLRFDCELPIREIAKRWDADPASLHHEYAKARREFRSALVEVVRFHHPSPEDEVERECAGLLDLLSSSSR